MENKSHTSRKVLDEGNEINAQRYRSHPEKHLMKGKQTQRHPEKH